MAGSPTCGKMSTGMRLTASVAHSAIAIRATTTVNGRLRAARTRRMTSSLARLHHERLDIAGRSRNLKQPAPHTQARESVVNFGLREQPLGFGDLVDISEPALISSRRLLHRCAGGSHLDRRVGGNAASTLEPRDRPVPPRAEIGRNLLRSG